MRANVEKIKVPEALTFELQSLVNSHTLPFIVVDRQYRIVAVNKAYEQTFGTSADHATGQHCYKISHGINKPCFMVGEDCPHEYLFRHGEQRSCIHIHSDEQHRMQQVRVTA